MTKETYKNDIKIFEIFNFYFKYFVFALINNGNINNIYIFDVEVYGI